MPDSIGWARSIAALSVCYFLAQVVVGWVFNPPRGSNPGGPEYSFVKNTISDLGNTACGPYGGSPVCSPRYVLMDLSFALLGVTLAVGSLLIYREFTVSDFKGERFAAISGFILLAIAGLGATFVGTFPENTNGVMHATGAGLAIGAGNLGILLLGFVLVSVPESMRHFMLFSASLLAGGSACLRIESSLRLGGRGNGEDRGVPGDGVVDHVRDVHNEGPLREGSDHASPMECPTGKTGAPCTPCAPHPCPAGTEAAPK